MELHNHLARPEQHTLLRSADHSQSVAAHTDALILHTTQIVVAAGRPTPMPAQCSLPPAVMS